MKGIRIPGAAWVAIPGLIGVFVTTYLQIAYPERAVELSALIVTALAAVSGVIALVVNANQDKAEAAGPAVNPNAGLPSPAGTPRGLSEPTPAPKPRSAISRFLF